MAARRQSVDATFWQSKEPIDPHELSPRHRVFAELMASGNYTQTEAAIKAGYPPSSAATAGSLLMNPNHSPKTVKYYRQIRNELSAKYDVTYESHLIKLAEIRDRAIDAGELSVAVTAEKARGQVAGLYVDRKEVLVTRIDQMSKEEVLQEIAKMQAEYPELARLTAPTIDMTALETGAKEDEKAA